MDLLLKSVKIIDPNSKHHLKSADILIRKGLIEKIAKNIPAATKMRIIEGKNLHVSPGWFDFRVNFMDPGYEHKEDISSGLNAASQGGFTGVLIMPSTDPITQNKSSIEYIRNKAAGHLVDAFPAGSLSTGMQGKDISEMFDMYKAGAVAFTDDKQVVENASLMLRALMYCDDIPAIVMVHPNDVSLSQGSMMHEGNISSVTGLKGNPDIAETLMINRDLELRAYVDTQIHFSGISSAKGTEIIKKAKKTTDKVTADIAAHQLFFNEKALSGFDSMYKLQPPLRSEGDQKALIKAVVEGTVNIICSDHTPQDKESKDLEFDYAECGMIACESFFGAVNTVMQDKMEITELIRTFCQSPRELLNIEIPVIAQDKPANLTVFDTKMKWIFSKEHILSKSSNSPFIGTQFIGKVIACINNGQTNFSA